MTFRLVRRDRSGLIGIGKDLVSQNEADGYEL